MISGKSDDLFNDVVEIHEETMIIGRAVSLAKEWYRAIYCGLAKRDEGPLLSAGDIDVEMEPVKKPDIDEDSWRDVT